MIEDKIMAYKFTLSEEKVKHFLNVSGWILIDPGCTTLHENGTETYEPPKYCYDINDNKIKCKVVDVMTEMIEFSLGVIYQI